MESSGATSTACPSVRAITSSEDREELVVRLVDVRRGSVPFLIFETTKSRPPVSERPR
jgi:hypothetical protein